jgi:hypothetical protein
VVIWSGDSAGRERPDQGAVSVTGRTGLGTTLGTSLQVSLCASALAIRSVYFVTHHNQPYVCSRIKRLLYLAVCWVLARTTSGPRGWRPRAAACGTPVCSPRWGVRIPGMTRTDTDPPQRSCGRRGSGKGSNRLRRWDPGSIHVINVIDSSRCLRNFGDALARAGGLEEIVVCCPLAVVGGDESGGARAYTHQYMHPQC